MCTGPPSALLMPVAIRAKIEHEPPDIDVSEVFDGPGKYLDANKRIGLRRNHHSAGSDKTLQSSTRIPAQRAQTLRVKR
jgi:hypothetical protein